MAKKGQVFQTYTEEFKIKAIQTYLNGIESYKVVAGRLEIRNCTKLKVWVRKYDSHGAPYFGYPGMQTALREAGYQVNQLSIQSVIRKKRNRSNYTPSVVYPNRLKRQFHAIGPQQKLVTDITYISDLGSRTPFGPELPNIRLRRTTHD